MNILFIAAHTPKYLLGKLGNNAQSLYRATEFLIKGLRKIQNVNLFVITSPDIASFPRCPICIKPYYDREEDVKVVSSLNISFIKQIWTIISIFNNAKKIIRKNQGITTIIIPYMVFRYVAVTRLLKGIFGDKIKICLIIPDIFFPSSKNSLVYFANKYTEKMARKSDCFVLYTESMAEYLNIQSKPYIIMEGVIDSKIGSAFHNKNLNNKKIITYTGALNIEYGILRLLEAMKLLKNPDIELHLLGRGNAEDIIKENVCTDNRIKFMGMQSKEKTLQEQMISTMLINPRSANDGEYTKYSFPSKNIEYLLTGKPTILAKLPGMPEEYFPYFVDADDCSPKALCIAINQVLSMTEKERIEFGKKGQKFIMENKNCYIQSNRILTLIENI